VVTLVAHAAGDDTAQRLALRPEIKIIDFTGSTENGEWIERNARQAQVFTEKAGVNPVVIDDVADLPAVARNLAFSLALYSGQMCTAPQNIYVPKPQADAVAKALAEAVSKLVADPARAVEILGAIQNDGVINRLEAARKGNVILDSQTLTHPVFPEARVRTPLLLRAEASESALYQREIFGPVAFVIATGSTEESLDLAARGAREAGALTFSVYSSRPEVIERARTLASEAGVALSENLTGGVFINQSAAFSDFHGTGANPAANAALTDSAFVASRFRVTQSRSHVA
jgi:phenylacetic acid degradation protein paaN